MIMAHFLTLGYFFLDHDFESLRGAFYDLGWAFFVDFASFSCSRFFEISLSLFKI